MNNMKKQNPLITDEHIVAYVDGELSANAEFERELRPDPALAVAAREYAAISKAFAHSASDSRFMLTASVDTKTRTMLREELATSRKQVRTAAPAPSAEPLRS